MKKQCIMLVVMFLSLQLSFSQNSIPQPKEYFGFQPGSDKNLFNYDQLIGYLKAVDEKPDRLLLKEVGTSPMGKTMYLAFISAPENLAKLDELKLINKKLALDANLTDDERNKFINEGKVFVMATLSMHSTEVAPSQSI